MTRDGRTTRPRHSTSRRRVNQSVLGVAERLGDAPSGGYVHRDARPAKDDTYLLRGEPHRFDGKCHPDCPNVR